MAKNNKIGVVLFSITSFPLYVLFVAHVASCASSRSSRRAAMCLIKDSKFFLASSSHSWKRKEGLGLQTIGVLFGSTKGTVAILIHRINLVAHQFEFGSG